MEKRYGRRLVALVGGFVQNHENRKSWLARVAKTSGISLRQAYAAFYGEWGLSKSVESKLVTAAKRKVREDDSELILRIQGYIRKLETVDREMYRADIDAARDFLAKYEDFARENVLGLIPPGVLDDCAE